MFTKLPKISSKLVQKTKTLKLTVISNEEPLSENLKLNIYVSKLQID